MVGVPTRKVQTRAADGTKSHRVFFLKEDDRYPPALPQNTVFGVMDTKAVWSIGGGTLTDDEFLTIINSIKFLE